MKALVEVGVVLHGSWTMQTEELLQHSTSGRKVMGTAASVAACVRASCRRMFDSWQALQALLVSRWPVQLNFHFEGAACR